MSAPSDAHAVRIARAGGATTAAVLVALAAHLAGGGSAPPPILLAAVVVLSWAAAVLLVGRRPRLWRQAAVIAGAQALLHGTFALGGGGTTAAGSMPGMPGMPDPAALSPTAASSLPRACTGADMVLWHGLAWLVTLVAWRWGERAAGRLLARLVLGPLGLLAPLRPPAVRRNDPPVVVAPAPRAVHLVVRPHRGPPQVA